MLSYWTMWKRVLTAAGHSYITSAPTTTTATAVIMGLVHEHRWEHNPDLAVHSEYPRDKEALETLTGLKTKEDTSRVLGKLLVAL